ncbi:hypothetical protein FA95DRAFT_1504973 [Auriscalpium vulgare]|uniref:Uncharacterized protein n=1 Tax=Auriscalpium vulgare TaxID=40419 RepID=A0ACB8R3Z6_9AGAM|nr:hypothetical protein FA95DRAFT_1504973 [Auriscalpium vulgare]
MQALREQGTNNWLKHQVEDMEEHLETALWNAAAFRDAEGHHQDEDFKESLHVHRRRVAGFHQLADLFRQGEGAFLAARQDRVVIFDGFRVNCSHFRQIYGW